MDRTQRLRTASGAVGEAHGGWAGSSQPLLAVIAISALLVALLAYVILRAGPDLIAAVGPWLAQLPSERSSQGWIAPAVAVGTLLAGAALAAMGMAAFVKGVRSDPFRWLAPVLIAFSSVVMTRLGLERSMGPLPATLFGVLTALLLLGGGVLVQAQGLVAACSGAVLLALPLLVLVLDQAHAARGLDKLLTVRDPNVLLALLVLSLTSVGVGLTAFVGRPSGGFARAAARSRDQERQREQLAMALERARVSELRSAALEEHAKALEQELRERSSFEYAPHAALTAAEEEAFAAAARPRGAQRWLIGLGLVGIGASLGAVALHMAMVQPLHAQVASERGAASRALAERERELGALRTELSGASARASEQLAIEKARAEAALAEAQVEAKAAKEQLAALTAQAAAAEAPKPAAQPAPKKRAARSAQRAGKRAAATPSASGNAGLRESVGDDPIGGLE